MFFIYFLHPIMFCILIGSISTDFVYRGLFLERIHHDKQGNTVVKSISLQVD